MDYVKGIFKNRPNRFIAEVEVDGSLEIAHVPNTGRCRELLVDDAVVWLKPSDNPKRKTKFSLHFVENKGVLVSLFSQQANSIVYDAIVNGKDITADEAIAKHAEWVEEIKKNNTITEESCEKVLQDEIGKVFADILGQCGVYARTEEGKAQFLKFVDKVNE